MLYIKIYVFFYKKKKNNKKKCLPMNNDSGIQQNRNMMFSGEEWL